MALASSYDHQQQLFCDIAVHQAKNVEEFMVANKSSYKTKGNLFVRYYLMAGKSKRIQLDTKEIPTTSGDHFSWNESFSLDCLGTQDSINSLQTSSVVFELRWRSSTGNTILGLGGSKLVGRAELPWKSVMEAPDMEIEKWVVMNPKNGSRLDGVKPPSVKIGMRVRVPIAMEMKKKSNRNVNYECYCHRHSGCNFCEGYDVLASVAAFEAL